ncbi:GumC family protein [Salinicola aestuarinus]|uniref:GumC family protein n=1 Tax=Salinicola aestuarinus TaxID=1949082 RepID=UPI000DA13037|nr:hypothetical protein [Salinicola aestuarinus]
MSRHSAAPPRRLVRAWWFIRDGLPAAGRYRRYVFAMLPFILAIWGLAIAYILVAPVNYKSTMTLILPGSGVGGSLNLESIGQATSQSSSAFATPALSPTENYKRLLTADITLRKGALHVDKTMDMLPKPSVSLVDQTNLIMVSLKAPTPQDAQNCLIALRQAFLEVLVELRQDEAAKREAADLAQIELLEEKLQQAQQQILEFQGASGLATMDQFHQRLNVIDGLRQDRRDLQLELERLQADAEGLSDTLQVSVADAHSALLLKADPIFQSLLSRYALVLTDWNQARATLGDNHLQLVELGAQKQTLQNVLLGRGQALTDLDREALLQFADLAVSDGRGRIFDDLLSAMGRIAGTEGALTEVSRQIRQQSDASQALVQTAARLSELLRERRVAEAVFSSALARLDTNKSDPFSSYPLVQTFESPSLPEAPSSPSVVLAIAGAVVATIFVITGFLLLWLRQPLIQLLLPKESSQSPYRVPGDSG